jgi:hypothetical protein
MELPHSRMGVTDWIPTGNKTLLLIPPVINTLTMTILNSVMVQINDQYLEYITQAQINTNTEQK